MSKEEYYKKMNIEHQESMERIWESSNILRYLYSREISDRTIKAFGLGADETRTRIMFPLFAPGIAGFNDVIGFQSRTICTDEPVRYKNTSNTEHYKKSHCLFGINVAFKSIKRSSTAHVVEGAFDAMKMYERGIINTVAVMGSIVSSEQANLLGMMCNTVVLVFDGDPPGLNGMANAFAPLVSSMVENCSAILLPSGYDPCSYLEHNPSLRECETKALADVWLGVRLDGLKEGGGANNIKSFRIKHAMITELANAYRGDPEASYGFINLARRVLDDI